MRVLHVIANMAPRYGGPPKAVFEMARAMVRLGHEAAIYTTNQDGPGVLDVPLDRPILIDGVEMHYFPVQAPRFWGTSIPLAQAIKRDIRSFDIVHIHNMYLFHGITTAYYCRKYNVPYILQPHGTFQPYIYKRHRVRKWIMETFCENWVVKKANALLYTTEEEMELASPHTFGTKGHIVPLGLDLEEYDQLPKVLRSSETSTRTILFFGRVNFKKGLDLLVEAFAKIEKVMPDVRLQIVGPDNEGYGEEIMKWSRERGIADKVELTGMKMGEDKLIALKSVDMFVLPSYSENFGIAVVEAMACETPIIISNNVSLWKEVAKNEAGIVISCDVDELAGVMLDLLSDPDKARQLASNARNFVERDLQWSQVSHKLYQAYHAVVKENDQWREDRKFQSQSSL